MKPSDGSAQRRGRPSRGVEPSVVVTVRLTGEELALLQRLSNEDSLSISDTVRAALAAWLGPDGPPTLRKSPLPDDDRIE